MVRFSLTTMNSHTNTTGTGSGVGSSVVGVGAAPDFSAANPQGSTRTGTESPTGSTEPGAQESVESGWIPAARTDARHPLTRLVDRARARFADQHPVYLWSVSDGELVGLIEGLHALAAQVEWLRLAVIREADRRDLAGRDGATSTGAWLAGRLRARPAHTNRAVRLARDLDQQLPATSQALAAGRISADAADVIAHTIRNLPRQARNPETISKTEEAMLEYAGRFAPHELARLGQAVLHRVDPDLADRILAKQLAREEDELRQARRLHIRPDPYSSAIHVSGRLDPETAEMLRIALEPLAAPRPDADGPDTRPYPQRLGDGLHELLRRYLGSGASPAHGGIKPQLVITIDHHDLVNGIGAARLLHTGTPVSALSAQIHACDADVLFHTTTPDGQQILTDPVRLFTGKTRRLLELRDKGCAFPGCDRPPAWCHAHHIHHWIKGGTTTPTNGVLLCGYHHRLIHQNHWQIRISPDHQPEFIPPEWIDPNQKPLRNTRLRT